MTGTVEEGREKDWGGGGKGWEW